MTKKFIFIADLHLQASEPEKIDKFIEFLATTAKNAQALYILGDFFEAWLGDDDKAEYIDKIKTALNNYSRHHQIYFMCGNRDFLVGQKFCAQTGCKLIADPTIINVNNIPTLLTHGDIFCSNDLWHLRYRKVVNSKIMQHLIMLLPLTIRKLLAKTLRKRSKNNRAKQPNQSFDIPYETIIQTMQTCNVKQFIHGHIHRAITQEIIIDDILCKRFCLPEWNNHNDILIL